MITPELTEYVQAELAKGKTRDELRKVLLAGGGWSEMDIDQAFRTVAPISSINSDTSALNLNTNSLNNSNLNTPKVFVPTLAPTPIISPNIFPPIEILPEEFPKEISPKVSIESGEVNIVAPVIAHNMASGTIALKPKKVFHWKPIVALVVFGAILFNIWYFYRPQIYKIPEEAMSLSKSLIQKVKSFFPVAQPATSPVQKNVQNENPVVLDPIVSTNTVAEIKDCGVTSAPDSNTPILYDNDPVLSCLGASAINCVNTKATLQNSLFPTTFEIIKMQDSCNFKLSYGADSTLTDVTGKKMALKYISCPINMVKAINNTNTTTPKFTSADKTNLSRYAAEMYFYGTIGVFIENNLNINKISGIGCSGDYIQSVIDSYKISTTPR